MRKMAMALQSFDERYELWIGDLDLDKNGTDKRLENRLNQAIAKYSSIAKIVEENDNLFNARKHVFVRVTSKRAFLELLKPETQLRFDGSILNIRKSDRIPSLKGQLISKGLFYFFNFS